MIAQLSALCFPLSPSAQWPANHSPPSLSDITGPNFFHHSWPDSLCAPILLTILFVLLSAQPRVAAIDAKMHRSDLCTPCTLGSGDLLHSVVRNPSQHSWCALAYHGANQFDLAIDKKRMHTNILFGINKSIGSSNLSYYP